MGTDTATVVQVRKDGTVLRDGDIVGRVEKGTKPTFASTLIGAPEATTWFGYDADGKLVTASFGTDTRKQCVREIVSAADPLVVRDIKITEDGFGRFIEARVDWAGNTFFVSQHKGEDYWVVDALFSRGSSCPVFSNGSGSRYTHPNIITGRAHDAVVAEVARLGITL